MATTKQTQKNLWRKCPPNYIPGNPVPPSAPSQPVSPVEAPVCCNDTPPVISGSGDRGCGGCGSVWVPPSNPIPVKK